MAVAGGGAGRCEHGRAAGAGQRGQRHHRSCQPTGRCGHRSRRASAGSGADGRELSAIFLSHRGGREETRPHMQIHAPGPRRSGATRFVGAPKAGRDRRFLDRSRSVNAGAEVRERYLGLQFWPAGRGYHAHDAAACREPGEADYRAGGANLQREAGASARFIPPWRRRCRRTAASTSSSTARRSSAQARGRRRPPKASSTFFVSISSGPPTRSAPRCRGCGVPAATS